MTPNFKASPVKHRLDLYVMGFILLIALAVATQLTTPRLQTMADVEKADELQNAPETGN